MLRKLGFYAVLAVAASADTSKFFRVDREREAEQLIYGEFYVSPDLFYVTQETYDQVSSAVTSPNVTRSIEFNPFGEDASGNLTDVTWTWRVNVTEVSLPGARLGHESEAIPHMIVTTQDFTWPGGGNISTELGGNMSFCLKTVQFTNGFTRDVTNGFEEDDASGTSCIPALGASCVGAILEDPMITSAGCDASSANELRWERLPQCKDSLRFAEQDERTRRGYLMRRYADLNDGASNSSTNWEYVSGEQLYYSRTGVYDPGARDAARAFQNESRALQIMLVQTGAQTEGKNMTSQLLCTRVSTEEYEGSGRVVAVSLGAVMVAALFAMALVL